MKTCKHLTDYLFDAKAVGPHTGLAPFIVLCEDCAAGAKQALEEREREIIEAKPSGKSGRAQRMAWYRRIIRDINADPMISISQQTQLAATLEARLQKEKYGPFA